MTRGAMKNPPPGLPNRRALPTLRGRGAEMPRARYGQLADARVRGLQAAFRKTSAPPAGYTANTVITEWLTLHCQGVWGSFSDGPVVRVRFTDPQDLARALAYFGGRAIAADGAPHRGRGG